MVLLELESHGWRWHCVQKQSPHSMLFLLLTSCLDGLERVRGTLHELCRSSGQHGYCATLNSTLYFENECAVLEVQVK